VRDYLGLQEGERPEPVSGRYPLGSAEAALKAAESIADSALRGSTVPVERLSQIAQTIDARWRAIGYDGDYAAWIARHKPDA